MKKVSVVIPGLEWNVDWLRQGNFRSDLETQWIDYFYAKGRKFPISLGYSQLIAQYLLKDSFAKMLHHYADLNLKNYIVVSPVHQQMGLHQMGVFCGNEILNISYTEAERLTTELNKIYKTEELVFHVVLPDLWLLETAQPLNYQSTCPFDLVDLIDLEYQITGRDAKQLRQLQAEIQMFLYGNSINPIREKNGQLAINGLWFWPNLYPEKVQNNQQTILLSNEFQWLHPENNVELNKVIPLMSNNLTGDQNMVIFIDNLHAFTRLLDHQAFAHEFNKIGQELMQPLLALKARKEIKELELISSGSNGGRLSLSRFPWPLFLSKETYQGRWLHP